MKARLLLVAALLTASAPALAAKHKAAAQAAGAGPSPVSKLHKLFDREWERAMREAPETASLAGDYRYNDRWSDLSPAAIQASHDGNQAALVQLARIDRKALPPGEQLSYDLFERQYAFAVEGYRFREFTMPVSPINWDGFGSASRLVQLLPFASEKDYADWIKRLQSYGALVDQNIALMRIGMKEGRVPPRITMQRIPDQVAAQIVAKPEDSPLYAPFTRFPAAVPADARTRLAADGQAAIRDVVLPAWKRFQDFFNKEYLPACRDTLAASALPDGAAYYAFKVREMTTTDLAPEAIHETGLKEVARIRGEMEKVMAQVKFKGSLPDFFKFLRSDKQFFYKTPDELFDAYVLLTKRIDPELVRLFGTLPRTPYGVKAIPPEQAPSATTAYYEPSAEDGSRAGYYYVNLYKIDTRPKWEMEALSLHESVPGHHLQIALAQEQRDVPKFRKHIWFTAFGEGWGLYAESLGPELGLYQDPYSKFGQLTYEMWRAVRLVVDTGIHSKGWSRQQAIDYFKDNAAKTENDIAVEVDRYISWPGQALAYKLGELKIKELRARATQQLGGRFDVRKFHDVVLGSGCVPLSILERHVDDWIAEQAKQR